MMFSDAALEIFRATVLAGIVVMLLYSGQRRHELTLHGWKLILVGFSLLLFGSIMDVTDEFDNLSQYVVIGDTPIQGVLEKIIGFLFGFICIAVGLILWIPSVTSMAQVKAMADKLKVSNKNLIAANASKSSFLANMSHEIRTPMTAILGYVDILSTEELSVDEQKQHLQVVKRNGTHLLTIINDILDFSKIEANKLTIEKAPTNIKKEIQQSLLTLEHVAREKGIDLGTHSFHFMGDSGSHYVTPLQTFHNNSTQPPVPVGVAAAMAVVVMAVVAGWRQLLRLTLTTRPRIRVRDVL